MKYFILTLSLAAVALSTALPLSRKATTNPGTMKGYLQLRGTEGNLVGSTFVDGDPPERLERLGRRPTEGRE
ncbi:hypothetical protein C8R43DRAFT_1141463 [Mycena crocata]|nr:hypothetical protein C8R43DRAFT_1141463 [Mycena crocata]